MKQLMISLDKKILDKSSVVARRMIEYGQTKELFILVPNEKKNAFDLSPTAHVQSTGGCKFFQFFSLINLGRKLLRNNDIEEVTAQDPFFTGLAGVILKFFTGKKLEVQLHGDFFGSVYYRNSGAINWFKYWLGIFIIKRADVIRAAGERVKQSLLKINLSDNKIIVRPVKIVSEEVVNYQPRIDLHDKYPGFVKIFLCLGRFDPVKNIPWLVDIFAEIVRDNPKYLLLIVGDGPEGRDIKTRIELLGMENNIKMESWTEDPISYFKTVDCLLFSSLSEGYGLVAMEAQAVGAPIIMTDVGVANYELKPGSKVMIVPVGDKIAFEQAILKI